ncbi:MAG TPA: hypothetical protein VJU59_27505, partial [Paraburkholderia sp.]|uniref:hypothetical protein n=1 Tax=Paraburkholderia sp. TaxID=1926495 RepID=UPI002B49207B
AQNAYSARNAATAGSYSRKWTSRIGQLATQNFDAPEIQEWDARRKIKGKGRVQNDWVELSKKRAKKGADLYDSAIIYGLQQCGVAVHNSIRIGWDALASNILAGRCYVISAVDGAALKHTMAIYRLEAADDEGYQYIFFDPNHYEVWCSDTELANYLSSAKSEYTVTTALLSEVRKI